MLRRTLKSPPSSSSKNVLGGATFSSSCVITSFRYVHFVNEPSKNNPNMRHLDIYARRDPQLAPYLLREVDIEYKRKCRKVNFVFWLSVLVCLIMLQSRESLETAFYLRNYTELLREELDAKDDDMDLRRAKMVQLLQLLKKVEQRAFEFAEKKGGKVSDRDLKKTQFNDQDLKEIEEILLSTQIPDSQRKTQEGTKEMKDLNLTGMSKSSLYSIKGNNNSNDKDDDEGEEKEVTKAPAA